MTIAEMNGPAPGNIKALIEARGLKKKSVAEKAGMTAQDFSGVLAGRRMLKVCEIVAFAKALNVEPNDILCPEDRAG